MSAAAQRAGRDDWLRDLAHVSAAALRRHPAATWIGLLLSFGVAACAGPWLAVPLAVAVGLVAGGMVRVRVPSAAWLALGVPALVVAVAPLRIWIPGSPSWLAWPEGRAVLASTATLTGFVMTQRATDLPRAPIVACLLAGSIAFGVFGFDEPPLVLRSGLGAAAALLTAVACLAATSVRGGWALAWATLAVPAVVTSMTWQDTWPLAVAAGALLAPWAARTGLALRGVVTERSAESAGADLVIALQRRAWPSAFLVFAAGGVLSGFWGRVVDQALGGMEYWTGLVVPAAGFVGPTGGALALVLLFHASWAGRSGFDRLAVWVAAALVPALLALPQIVHEVVTTGAPPSAFTHLLDARVPLTILVTGLVVGRRARDEGVGAVGVLLLLVLAGAVALVELVPALELVSTSRAAYPLYSVAWVAVVHWLVVRRTSGRFLLAVVLPCGLLSVLAQSVWSGSVRYVASAVVEGTAGWLVAIVVILAARRVRSMTAIPADHPIVADWGDS